MKKEKNVYITGIVTLFIIIGIGLCQYNVQAPQNMSPRIILLYQKYQIIHKMYKHMILKVIRKL